MESTRETVGAESRLANSLTSRMVIERNLNKRFSEIE